MDKVVRCDDGYSCSPDAWCGEQNGIHGCHCNENFGGDGQICTTTMRPIDCREILQAGNTRSGVYTIYPENFPQGSLDVYCDMDTDGGGWIVSLTN